MLILMQLNFLSVPITSSGLARRPGRAHPTAGAPGAGVAMKTLCLLGVWLMLVVLLSPHTVLAQPAMQDLDLRIRTLESEGRAHPQQAADTLELLLPSTGKFSPQRLELLTVQGVTLAMSVQSKTAERQAAALATWGRLSAAPNATLATAAALLVRAHMAIRAGDLKDADAIMQQAMALLPPTTAPRDRWRFVNAWGNIKDGRGLLDEAVRLFHEALALADQQSDAWIQSNTRNSLAYSYLGANQLERARTFNQEALALAEKAQDWDALAQAHNMHSIILDATDDRVGERRATELAIKYAGLAGSKMYQTRLLANLADSYLKTAEFKTALAYAEQALLLARELKDIDTENIALVNIGMAHIGLRHLELGKRYVREAMLIDERRDSITGVSNLWRDLGAALEKAGDEAGAVTALHKYRRLAVDVLREDQQNAILAIQEQYDADQRERSLVLLNRQNQIKAEQLRHGELYQLLWGLLAATFALSFTAVALLYRRTRRMNRLLSGNNAQLKVQGECDPLTGLANRRHFQAVVHQWASDGKLEGAAYLLDIDHFKHINDRYGHSAGDAVLVEVARRLRETLREQDLIVRWGGEEFLVLVRTALADQVDALAQRLLSVLEEVPVSVDGTCIPITGSIGYASFPIGPNRLGVHWERAIELVDGAMYLAKAQGRNRAYGVRFPHACDAAALKAATQSLEAARHDGRVALTQLLGCTQLAQAT